MSLPQCFPRSSHGYHAQPKGGEKLGEVGLSLSLLTVLIVLVSFGPDPYLTGEAAYETITGVQSTGVMACAKHFLANNQEHWRYGLSADIDDRTNHELYMYPYYRAVEVCQGLICVFGMEANDDHRLASHPLCAHTIASTRLRHVTMQRFWDPLDHFVKILASRGS